MRLDYSFNIRLKLTKIQFYLEKLRLLKNLYKQINYETKIKKVNPKRMLSRLEEQIRSTNKRTKKIKNKPPASRLNPRSKAKTNKINKPLYYSSDLKSLATMSPK